MDYRLSYDNTEELFEDCSSLKERCKELSEKSPNIILIAENWRKRSPFYEYNPSKATFICHSFSEYSDSSEGTPEKEVNEF